VYEARLFCMRPCLKEVRGIDIYIFGSNGQAKEAVAFRGMRLKRGSRVEIARFVGKLCRFRIVKSGLYE
jgi:hypothetical protein